MKRFFYTIVFIFVLLLSQMPAKAQGNIAQETNEYVKLSMKLLGAVKNNEEYKPFVGEMKNISLDKLGDALRTDDEIKAFWINTYNAYVQILLIQDPSLFEDRGAFFKEDRVNIGGEMFSFDFMEHGVIRGSKVKLSMGFLKDPFAGELEKKFRVDQTDGRVHFALNCGASSCPYIAVYSSVNLENELDAIAQQFLKMTTEYDASKNEANVTTLFNWFKGDFSDKGGPVGFLKKYQVIPDSANPDINFKDYDWTLSLGNFTDLIIYN
ncbi:MAG: hypothetical protein ACI9XJ_000397 [Marivirga sp.]|jgi:hypothetical protein